MCVNIVAHLNSREVIDCQKVVAMAQDEDYHSLCPPQVVKDSTFDGGGRVLDHLLYTQQTANDVVNKKICSSDIHTLTTLVTRTHAPMHAHACTRTHMHAHARTHTRHTHMYVHHAHMHTHIHTCTHAHTHTVRTCIHTHTTHTTHWHPCMTPHLTLLLHYTSPHISPALHITSHHPCTTHHLTSPLHYTSLPPHHNEELVPGHSLKRLHQVGGESEGVPKSELSFSKELGTCILHDGFLSEGVLEVGDKVGQANLLHVHKGIEEVGGDCVYVCTCACVCVTL